MIRPFRWTRFVGIGMAFGLMLVGCTATGEAISEPSSDLVPTSEGATEGTTTCGEWSDASDSERAGVLASVVKYEAAFGFSDGEGYANINRANAKVMGPHGTIADGYNEVIDLVCDGRDATTTILEAKTTRLDLVSSDLSCDSFIAANADSRDAWMATAASVYDREVADEATLEVLCEAFPESYFITVIGSPDTYFGTIQTTYRRWKGSSIPLLSSSGYTSVVGFESSIEPPTSDIKNSKPGFAEIKFSIKTTVTYTNTTEGRVNPMGMLAIHVAPVWPADSPLCELAGKAKENLMNKGSSPDWCLPLTVLTASAGSLEPGATVSKANTGTFTATVPEAEVDSVKELILAGTPTWIAFLTNESGLDASVERSKTCGLHRILYFYPVLTYRGNLETPACTLDLS